MGAASGSRCHGATAAAASCARAARVLTTTLAAAADAVRVQYGTGLAGVQVHATGCEKEPICDQIEFITGGGVETPPAPWQDRPTFQQAVEIRR